MSSLGNEKRPKSFSEFSGSDNGPVKYLEAVIKNNKHPNCIFLTGGSGTGKTTLAKLYAKATLCLNRKQGEHEPCGKCTNCIANEPENIFEYTVKEASDFKSAIGSIVTLTKSQPVLSDLDNDLREDQFRRFIILDEIQNCLKGDTLILTNVGLKRIDDSSILNNKVLSLNETTNEWEFKNVIQHIPKQVDDIIIIKTKKGNVECTKNHKIRTSLGWKYAKEIDTSDKILCPVNVGVVNFLLQWIKMVVLENILMAITTLEEGLQTKKLLYQKKRKV